MQWYKHDTDATQDAKIKKLLIRHGAVGYAVYFHCLELIAAETSETNLTFVLEHDSEIIADNLKIQGTADKSGIEIVETIMRYIIQLGLFQESGGKVFCFKLLKRLDTSMTSNPRFREMISSAKTNHDFNKENHDRIMIPSCKPSSLQANKQTNGGDSAKSRPLPKFQKPTVEEVKAYCKERKNQVDAEQFYSFYESKGWMIGKNHMKNWRFAVHTWEKREPAIGGRPVPQAPVYRDHECGYCNATIIGTTGVCVRCGWKPGDDIPENREWYDRNIEKHGGKR